MSSRRTKQHRQWILTAGLGGTCAMVAIVAYIGSTSSPEENTAEIQTAILIEPPLTAILVEPKLKEINPSTPEPQATPKTSPPVAKQEEATPPVATREPAEKPTPADQIADNSTDAARPPDSLTTTPKIEASPKTLLINEKPFILLGLESTRDAATKRRDDLMKRAADDRQWSVYRPLLKKSLDAAFKEIKSGNGVSEFSEVWKEPVFYQTFLQWKTLSLFPPHTLASGFEDSYYGQFFFWLLNNNAAMEEVLLTMQPEDDPAKVLNFLNEAWMKNEENYVKYFNLTLACAVVFDQEITISNPVGDMEKDFIQTVDPLERYQWFIKQNDKGKLEAPVHRSSARDLIWVVNAPVAESELDWAIRNMRLKRKSWGRAYGNVQYLMERAVEGLNPYEEYSFKEIEEEGGICGDQTYYCINTARALGIPAIGLSGETSRGGHAWAAIKIEDDEWTTKVGRIGGVSKGQARNPQTGKMITEQEILLWNDRDHRSESVTLNVARHLWLASYLATTEFKEQRATAVQIARKAGETFPETWLAIYRMLEDETTLSGKPPKPTNLDEWKSFVSDMRREFRENPRFMALAAKAENQYIFPYIPLSDARRAMARERRQIERYSGEQADLIAQSLKREADLIKKDDGPDAEKDIAQLYDKALKDHGSNVSAFKTMADDYFSYFAKDKEKAAKVTRDIELAFKRVISSGDGDYFRAKTEAGILKMICAFYRACDEEKRAALLEKRYQRQLARATRGAL